jgi:enoyl-CoA hydratase
MGYETVEYEKEGRLGIIKLNRPHALNALSRELWRDIEAGLREAAADEDVGTMVITGEGRAFCAGADLKEERVEGASHMDFRRGIMVAQNITRIIRETDKPVIAAVNGYALGGGCEIALACDIIIASEEAIFGFPETGVGLFLTGGSTHLLPRLVGLAKAKELVFTGDFVDANEALRIGLVNRVVAADALMNEARETAEKVLSKSAASIALAKWGLNAGAESSLNAALAYETEAVVSTMLSRDSVEAARAFAERKSGAE